MSEYTKMIESERVQRMNPRNRQDPFRYYFHQPGKHVMVFVYDHGSPYSVLAVADTAEALCVELDHHEANFTNRELDLQRKDLEEALRRYEEDNSPSSPSSLSLWAKVRQFFGFKN